MPVPVDQIVQDFALGGYKMLEAIMGEGYDPLCEPKDLLMLQILGLAIGKARGADMAQLLKLLMAVVEGLDVKPIEDLMDSL